MAHKIKTASQSNVDFINGIVSFMGVNLNVYAFNIDGILIDTGAEKLMDAFIPFFKKADIEKVMITHAHEDHTGGAHFLQKELGTPLYIHSQFIDREQQTAAYPLYRKLFWGKRKPFTAQAAPEKFTSKKDHWQAIYTPGHASDHYAYLNTSTGQLFSGDLYVHPRTKLILRDESIPDTISSIKKVLTYDFAEMFCCHAGYVKDGKKALQKKLDYLEDLSGKVLELHDKGYNEKAIQKEFFPKTYPIQYFSLGEWGTKHIIHSIIQQN